MIIRTEQIKCDKCGMKFTIRDDVNPYSIQVFYTDITILGVSLRGQSVPAKRPIHFDLCPICYNKFSEFFPERVPFIGPGVAKK